MVLSLVAARGANMTEEAIRVQSRASMTQAALKLANEAQARFRADLQAELDKIDRDTEKELEALRSQQRESNASEQNGNRQSGDDSDIASMLLGANTDILIKYHILREDEISSTRSKDIDTSNTVESREEPPPGLQELLNISDSISESVATDSDLESEDIKGWLKEEAVRFQYDPDSFGTPASSSSSERSFRVSAGFSVQEQSSSKRYPSNKEPCQKASDRQSDSKPNEIKQAQNDTKGSSSRDSDVLLNHIQDLPKSQVDKGKGVHTEYDPHRGCSLVPQIEASKPAGTSKNPFDLDRGPKRETIPTPRCSPVLETTKKMDKDTENPSSTLRHPLQVSDMFSIHTVASQPATSNKCPIKGEKDKKPSSNPRQFPVGSVSASQPVIGSKRARSPSPQTPKYPNSPEGSQESTRRRQPRRNSITPVSSYNVKSKFRRMVGRLEGPEHDFEAMGSGQKLTNGHRWVRVDGSVELQAQMVDDIDIPIVNAYWHKDSMLLWFPALFHTHLSI
ncbi:hypothetical protein FHL15_004899 [Xylaria flabelliformis]|uniref:Uncharacterized protein n=1 Tax=Xylaria flabelliformis TaxID=2512241 RepID=A0A553I1R6_9PEZI|nr:hypothetical protein FHL15_004899 [Xylaria flabelliformis]